MDFLHPYAAAGRPAAPDEQGEPGLRVPRALARTTGANRRGRRAQATASWAARTPSPSATEPRLPAPLPRRRPSRCTSAGRRSRPRDTAPRPSAIKSARTGRSPSGMVGRDQEDPLGRDASRAHRILAMPAFSRVQLPDLNPLREVAPRAAQPNAALRQLSVDRARLVKG